MPLRPFLHRLTLLGVKPSHEIWEAFLIRKINFVSLAALFNVTLGFTVFPFFGLADLQPVLLVSIFLAPLVILVNIRFGYVAGSYGFFLIGLFVVVALSIRLGHDSYFPLFLFPISLSIVQLLGRRETMVHMIILLGLYLAGISWMVWCFYHDSYRQEFPEETIAKVRIFDIVLSAFTGVVFVILITLENNRQEKIIRDMLKEKDVLVAEVFHRVKNNMNIVTSLLNLRSHISGSEEVKEALEDCRNRVFSMALVHEKIFHSKEVSRLDFGEYAHDLADEISMSLGLSGDDMITVRSDEMELPLNFAIPCGLILNELVTNSCKHGRVGDRPLHISIGIQSEGGKRVIEVQDNGPGASEQQMQREGSLGLDLIRSLCQQIDAEFQFSSRDGLHFQMKF